MKFVDLRRATVNVYTGKHDFRWLPSDLLESVAGALRTSCLGRLPRPAPDLTRSVDGLMSQYLLLRSCVYKELGLHMRITTRISSYPQTSSHWYWRALR